ncbi:hypothetical protein TorRG33x02_230280, partial [Trema orientale]
MDLEHEVKLCEHLRLDDNDDGPIVELRKESIDARKDQMGYFLVEKIMGNHLASREGLENNMRAVWR